MRCTRVSVVVCAFAASCIPHPVTVFPRVADVSPGQEVVAAITEHGVIELPPPAVLRADHTVYRHSDPYARGVYTSEVVHLAPDDLVVVRAAGGQTFGPISVHAKRPGLVPAGWAVVVVGTIVSIVATTIAIASTDPNAFFGTATDLAYGALGIAGFTASVTLGGFLIYAGSNPLHISYATGQR